MRHALKPPPFVYDPPQTGLRILYQDDDLLVLSKPSGLLSVPGKGAGHEDCLESRAKAKFSNALLIHRLDVETSGIFVMALNKKAQANLGKQFERRKTQKTYIARVWGHVEHDSGRVDLPLRCDWENRPRQMVCYEHGRPAQTDWQVLARETPVANIEITRIMLKPITGRSHQLRVHMQAIGHPILGEVFYAHDEARDAAPRLQLHAQSLGLYHPGDGRFMIFHDEAPF